MIIVMNHNATKSQIDHVCDVADKARVKTHVVQGEEQVSISMIGHTEALNPRDFQTLEGVEEVIRISRPFKQASVDSRKERSRITLPQGLVISDTDFLVMAGPCSVESEDQTVRIAHAVKKAGATVLRGGAFKPRSSPYSFQGLGEEGLKILKTAREETGLPIISELMDLKHLDMVMEYVDIIQIGARNMQNFNLLKELGKIDKPVMLKRGPSATIDEWMMSAEYILVGGNHRVILCERGIRSFDNHYARNTLDLNAVPIVKRLSHLPIVVDPSHGTGYRHLVSPLAKAAMAVGADSLIVEVHDHPDEALSDGPQALLPEDFSELMQDLSKMAEPCGKKLQRELKG
jgi:3-deoxy-7-phosphoheptulonate synthase